MVDPLRRFLVYRPERGRRCHDHAGSEWQNTWRSMAERERLVKITLLGQEYAFYTGASDEDMEKILGLVKSLLPDEASGSQAGTLAVGKTAMLACLNIASRYIRLQQDYEKLHHQNERRAAGLADQIDAVLQAEKKDEDV